MCGVSKMNSAGCNVVERNELLITPHRTHTHPTFLVMVNRRNALACTLKSKERDFAAHSALVPVAAMLKKLGTGSAQRWMVAMHQSCYLASVGLLPP